MKIGFIGLGIMGKPMAKNLLKAGYTDLLVNNRSQAPVQELEAAGAVHKVNTEEGALYQYCGRQSQGHRDCFLLKCERCGRIRHVDCTQLQSLYDHLEKEHHFRINPRGTLFSGVCDVCAGEEERNHGAQ